MSLKRTIQRVLQKRLGFKAYLFAFARFKIRTLAWDKKERDFFHFLQLLPKQGIYLDIGANLGIMTFYLSRFSSKAQVIAFEPVPPNFETLQKVTSHFNLKNVTCEPLALGNESGTISIVMPEMNGVKMQGLSHVADANTKGDVYHAPVQPLDEYLSNSTNPVTGIKIDVENHEYEVLSGALRILRSYKPAIYCELWDNDNRQKCIQLLEGEGYFTFQLNRGKLQPYQKEKSVSQNFFFLARKD